MEALQSEILPNPCGMNRKILINHSYIHLYKFKWYRIVASAITGIAGIFLVYVVYDIVNQRDIDLKSYTDFRVNIVGVFAFIFFYELLSIINDWIDKYWKWHIHTRKRFAIQFFIDFLLVIIVFVPVGWAISGYIAIDQKVDYWEDALIIGSVSIVITFLAVIFELAIFFLTEWKESQLLVEKFRTENLEFRIDRLKEQLNPHFLFNNLNTLYALIIENPVKASEFVLELADIYRYLLKNKDEEIISLKEELEFTRSYIFLISNRFAGSVHIQVDLPVTVLSSNIPPLTLQMLIENAIKHNSFDKLNPLEVRIFESQNKIIIENILQPKMETVETTHIGLNNLKERYRFLSGQDIEILKNDHKFIVMLPIIYK